MKTLALKVIKDKWRDAIVNSLKVDKFCRDNYGKPVTLFIGLNAKRPPKDDDYPLVILRMGTKVEGVQEDRNVYAISIGWGIINDNVNEEQRPGPQQVSSTQVNQDTTTKVVELEGLDDCDELGQLIIEELAEVNPSCQLGKVDYDIEGVDFFPKIIGEMVLQLEIEPVIGRQLEY